VVLFYPWKLFTPFYKDKVARIATVFLKITHEGGRKSLEYFEEARGSGFSIIYSKRGVRGSYAFAGDIIHYNMMILLAMILASPGLKIKKRLLFTLVGFLILFFIHASQVAFKAESECAKDAQKLYDTAQLYSDTERQFYDGVTKFFEAFGQQLLPFAIWVLLCAPAILKAWRVSPQVEASKEKT
jgi:hypothetical protein